MKAKELKPKIATIPVPIDQWEAFTPKQFLRSCPAFCKVAHQKSLRKGKQIGKKPPNFHLEVIASSILYQIWDVFQPYCHDRKIYSAL